VPPLLLSLVDEAVSDDESDAEWSS